MRLLAKDEVLSGVRGNIATLATIVIDIRTGDVQLQIPQQQSVSWSFQELVEVPQGGSRSHLRGLADSRR